MAVARLNLPVNVTGYMGMVENMVSGDAFKLGDVLTSRQGKTIEVLNTDAEGRLVLADVLDVAVEQGADAADRSGDADRGLRGRLGHRCGRLDDQRSGLV